MRAYAAYRNFRPFTDAEAWALFRIAAITEGVGWTLLIIGIGLRDFVMHGNDYAVQLAGRTHGMLFLAYIVAALVLAPSLRWSLGRTFVAGLCSVPPYGSILFELYESDRRRTTAARRFYRWSRYHQLVSD